MLVNESFVLNPSQTMTVDDFTPNPQPPTPLIIDYILIAILILLFLIGAPINLIAFAQLHQKSPSATTRPGLHLLKIHLNLSDLMIIFIYTCTKICWLITYQWRGGDFLCKFMQFLSSTSFQISSNIIVCIAFDRLLVVLYKRRSGDIRRVIKLSLAFAWFSAILVNIPQLFAWRVLKPYPNVAWEQCVTVWFYKRFEMISDPNSTKPFSDPIMNENVYYFFHLVLVFWLPLLLIATFYIIVACFLERLTSEHKPLQDTKSNRYHVNVAKWFPKRYHCNSSSDTYTMSQLTSEADPDRRSSSITNNSTTITLLVPNEIDAVKRKHIKTSVLLICAYIVCWLPYNLLALWHHVDSKSFRQYENMLRFVYHLIILNSVINPFLYGIISSFKHRPRTV